MVTEVSEGSAMDETVQQVLAQGGTIDITTTGRTSGQSRRIEIVFYNFDGAIYISGIPGRPRSWYANLRAQPRFTFHLKEGVTADLPARATPILDPAQRRAVLTSIVQRVAESYGQAYNVNIKEWVVSSPLVSVAFEND